jgi:small subunit ribosomal protein S11
MSDEKEVKTEAVVEETSAKGKKSAGKAVASKGARSAKGKKRTIKAVPQGKAFVHASLNNTIVSVTDNNGNVLAWGSAGNAGFRGPKKSTPFAASIVVEKVIDLLVPFGMKDIHIITKGIGGGRDSAIRTFNTKGMNILSVKETTPVPHNGCRPRRARRV